MITEVIHQYNFLYQVFWTPVQHAEIRNRYFVKVIASENLASNFIDRSNSASKYS